MMVWKDSSVAESRAALPEDLSSSPNTHMVIRSHLEYLYQWIWCPLWPLLVPGKPVVQRHTYSYFWLTYVMWKLREGTFQEWLSLTSIEPLNTSKILSNFLELLMLTLIWVKVISFLLDNSPILLKHFFFLYGHFLFSLAVTNEENILSLSW